MPDLRALLHDASPPAARRTDLDQIHDQARRRRRFRRGAGALACSALVVVAVWAPGSLIEERVELLPADGGASTAPAPPPLPSPAHVPPLPSDGVVESGDDWDLIVRADPEVTVQLGQGRYPGTVPSEYEMLSTRGELTRPHRLSQAGVFFTDRSPVVETLVAGPVDARATRVEVRIADEVRTADLYAAGSDLLYVLRVPGRHHYEVIRAYDEHGEEIDQMGGVRTQPAPSDDGGCADEHIRGEAVTWEQQLDAALMDIQRGEPWGELTAAVGAGARDLLRRCDSLHPAASTLIESVAAVEGAWPDDEDRIEEALLATVVFTRPCPAVEVETHAVEHGDMQTDPNGATDATSTLFFIADVVYGDGRLAVFLAEANDLGPSPAVEVGDVLVVPRLPGCSS